MISKWTEREREILGQWMQTSSPSLMKTIEGDIVIYTGGSVVRHQKSAWAFSEAHMVERSRKSVVHLVI
uniref:Uncharacterized protein n=1 Tax=Arion vulgaris TaxID=1028688 RepID=A0A0B6Z7A0_9EUPU